ncbi:hypothetical protein SODALDRAFT_101574 [Sodiomyces alkalinus F11]|uniref:Uncharacterized protein n=1 Tax=Sodiomyces alkalinus (strain CBS 110278 / VKM F-3762 / F11) TaxID=1314773 RepID=A0A3N2Q1R2_SODAK|nr:hypothetical protein SODALDRAFT_101574 [Sodiomyces alkalinus F11]ROT40646.1 hypothetical protein SODALDRAFT_101574 [Sodiomyces alkalinus F11]
MSITAARREDIGRLETSINDAITWMEDKSTELQAMVDLVSSISRERREQMSRSASSSTRKNKMGETVSIDDTIQKYERMITELRTAIGNKRREADRLKNEKRDLEKYEDGI